MYVEVALPIPHLTPLTYRVLPNELVAMGMRVVVSVGRRALTGVVVKIKEQAPEKISRIKTLIKILDQIPALPPELLELGKWLAEYYACSWGEALAAMLPGLLKPALHEIINLVSPAPGPIPAGIAQQLLERLTAKPLTRQELLPGLPRNASLVLRKLVQAGYVTIQTRVSQLRTQAATPLTAPLCQPPLNLTAQQAKLFAVIQEKMRQQTYATLLLHGVTGSGKTELYLQAIAHALEKGQGAILLVPEISLTPQTCARITARFGTQVAVLHSALSPRQRIEAWFRLRNGEARVALGARSAIFAPVRHLGLIIVDEEPEGSYKQEDVPRYHARDVAVVRARNQGVVLILGSATPAIESYYNTQQGRYQLLSLPDRVDGKKLPEVRLVDMGMELRRTGQVMLFSQVLEDELRQCLEKKEQAILFLNRRGFAPVVMCPVCRTILQCPDCSLTLVYHAEGDCLRCHSCGRKLPARPACPRCGSACIRLQGAGTQRVEQELKARFPSARVFRLDFDSTRQKGFLEKAFTRFGQREADVLIGTQIVAKGIDFPGVTLVGIISADTALHLPDFRAEERTFQLVVQVAGRSGRGGQPGRVIVQTFHASHPIMALAQKQGYQEFYLREIQQRQALSYPPFSRLAKVICRSKKAELAGQMAEKIAARLRPLAGAGDSILGPAPSPHAKIAGEVRFQVLLKCSSPTSRSRLLKALNLIPESPQVKVTVDVDPQSLL